MATKVASRTTPLHRERLLAYIRGQESYHVGEMGKASHGDTYSRHYAIACALSHILEDISGGTFDVAEVAG